jgi:SHS2 domain-containing protein
MKKGYAFLEDWSFTDVAFDAWGETLEELFEVSAQATFEVMAELQKVKPVITREVTVEGDDEESLLYDWLTELIYRKDVEGIIFSNYDIMIKKNETYDLKATIKGEYVVDFKGELGRDVKAVTMHLFQVRKTQKGWKARVLLDI